MHQIRNPRAPSSSTHLFRTIEWVTLGAAAACVALAVIRITHAVSLFTPLQLVTSGAEEEALASIWRFLHGQAVYTDPRVIPFTASYFNWLFYGLYGAVAESALRVCGLREAWVPTICRLITLFLAGSGAVIMARTLARVGRVRRPVACALAAIAFFNPLCGFWIITTRPDVGAAVFELAAVAAFLQGRNRIVVALLFAAAFAFKQTSVGAVVGIMGAMILLHDRVSGPGVDGNRDQFVFAAVFIFSALIPFCVLGPIYRHGFLLSQINSGFQVIWAMQHLGSALIKMPFIAAALLAAPWCWSRSDRRLRTVGLVLLATFVAEFVASGKGGAGDYYFLSLGVWSALWLGFAMEEFDLKWPIGAAAVAQVLAVALVIFGHHGAVDPGNAAKPYEQLARYLATRPGPVFVRDTYGDLPWVSATAPHFVIAYNNEVDAQAGVTFERGGWQGLMAQGYFATVVTKEAQLDVPDGLLSRYRFVREEAGWRYYERH